MLSPEQSRAARGWLDWSQSDLAKRASVSLSTVRDFEKGRRTPIPNNLDALRRAIEAQGITLDFDGEGKPKGIALGDAPEPQSPSRPKRAKSGRKSGTGARG